MTNKVEVRFNNEVVGYLSITRDKLIAFQYSSYWLKNGFSISPFSLPLTDKVFIPKSNVFNGLFGVFFDSLPDSWGRLLLDRKLKLLGRSDISELERLLFLDEHGLGALKYYPNEEIIKNSIKEIDFDRLSLECSSFIEGNGISDFDELYTLGSSSGGTRPKIFASIDNKPYLVKFFTKTDGTNAGKMEYDYSLCAKKCGIHMSDTKLLPSSICNGFFAIERFDYDKSEKVHMISASGLLEFDFNTPATDYLDLFKLTKILTINNHDDLLQLFKRMCFNVFAHNLDDHGKNFSYLYDRNKMVWTLSPAYDLTYSHTYFGEHTTSINHKGKNINDNDLFVVGVSSGLKKDEVKKEIKTIKEIVMKDLKQYLQ